MSRLNRLLSWWTRVYSGMIFRINPKMDRLAPELNAPYHGQMRPTIFRGQLV